MKKLVVNGAEIDVSDIDIAITKQSARINEITSAVGNFSTTIELPSTNNNLKALVWPNNINALQKTVRQLTSYELYDNGVLVSFGFIRILSVKETITLFLFSGNASVSELLSSFKVNELDVSTLDYSLITAEVEARRLLTSEMCLPNVWRGGYVDSATPFGVMDFRPSFYVEFIINKIFEAIGYEVKYDFGGDDDTSSLFAKTLTVDGKKEWQYNTDGYDFHVTLPVDLAPKNASYRFCAQDILKCADDLEIKGAPIGAQFYTPITFPLSWPQVLVITSKDRLLTTGLGGYIDIEILTTSTGGTIEILCENTDECIGSLDYTTTGIYRVNIGFDTPPPLPFTEDYSYIIFPYAASDTYCVHGGELYHKSDFSKKAKQRGSYVDQFKSNVQGCLPDVKASEFVLSVLNTFGLSLSVDEDKRIANIVAFDTVLNNITKSKDWTNIVDLSEPAEILYEYFDNFGQNNLFKYKTDDKDLRIASTTIGEGQIIVNNDYLEGSIVYYESLFSALVRAKPTPLLPTLACCESLIYGDLNIKLAYSEITTNNIITMYNSTAPTFSNELIFDELSFSKRIVNNYRAITRALNNNVALRIPLRVNNIIFYEYSFTNPIYLNFSNNYNGQISGHFYVDFIEQFKVGANESTIVQLIKID